METLYIALWASVHRLYIGENGRKKKTVLVLLYRALVVWSAFSVCFHIIEVAIWGYGFPHFGERFLIAILATEFILGVNIVLQLDRAREPSLKKMNA